MPKLLVTKKRMVSDLQLFICAHCVFSGYLDATGPTVSTTDRTSILTLLCSSGKMMDECDEYLLQLVVSRRCQVDRI